jgi:flagellar biosynthetic protein FlhB
MEESEFDKSELPTPHKLARAREKGSVARGADLGFLTGLTTLLGYAWIAGPQLGASISQAVRGALVQGPTLADGPDAMFSAVALLFSAVAQPLALMAGSIFLAVLLFEIVQTGVVFSAQPLKPDFSRLNPAKGLKRLFSLRLLLETGKNILKLALYTSVGYLVVSGALHSDIAAVVDGRGLLALMARMGFRLLASFAAVAVVFAVLDQLIARRDFLKRMRMSRREVRREARDREGDPRLKQKRKQLHAQFVKTSQSLRNLRKADVLITNPQHIALALRYEPRTMHAPMIVSIGVDHLAQRFKRLAFIYGIPVVVNPPLARELYGKATLNGPVPEHCFRQVADIYNSLRRQSATQDTERAHV